MQNSNIKAAARALLICQRSEGSSVPSIMMPSCVLWTVKTHLAGAAQQPEDFLQLHDAPHSHESPHLHSPSEHSHVLQQDDLQLQSSPQQQLSPHVHFSPQSQFAILAVNMGVG